MKEEVIQGDCLEVMKRLDENSVDSIVTDPPYELGFMGKSWDNTGIANNKEMWKECLRVLKPGGHLLSFGGTRTYHRMASAIEDAGFEVRDMIEWVYGCLSEDTEILTESGYKPLHKLTQYDRIGVYDITNNIYKWERPQRYSVYKVHQDTAYRIKSDYTDQVVSRNHRCLVEREGKLVFIQAEELNEVEYMPTLSEDFYSLQENSNRKLLLKELLRKGKGLAQKVFGKWAGKEVSEQRIEVRKEPSLERWSNLLEETRKLQADKICEVSEGVFTDGEKRWICNGTSFDNGSILGDMFRENPSSASYQSRPTGQPTGKPDVISIKQGTQITRRARVTKIEYSGIIFCPTVSTGAFVARRNGQVFITGNSGFPKSLNIGKAVDKIQGNERKFVKTHIQSVQDRKPGNSLEGSKDASLAWQFPVTKGNSEWEGWGTALKPAHEPICMARKPLGQQELDIAKNICYNITEKGLITNSKIIWRIKNVKNVEKQKTSNYSTQTQQQKMVEVSAEFVETKENESVGKKIQKLIDSICESGIQETGNKQEKQVQKATSKTKTEYQDTGENININEKQKPLKHTEESANVVENKDLSSLPLTTLEVEEDSTEKKSKTETSMSSLKSTDTQKTDIDCSAQTAISHWVCMDIVRTLKVSFEGKEYNFAELSDGSLVWNEALEPYRKQQKLNVAENCLKYGTGGINIDESRVDYNGEIPNIGGRANHTRGDGYGFKELGENIEANTQGRFPANLIHDNSEEVRECFPEAGKGNGKGAYNYAGREYNNKDASMFNGDKPQAPSNFNDSGNASRFFKSIMADSLCTLCCLPFDIKHDTMSVCKNINVNSAEKSLKTTQATTEVIAPQSATTPDNKKFVQSVRSVANLCDLCGTYIAHVLVGEKTVHQEGEVRGQIFTTKQKKQILDNVLASFVEMRGKKDTIPTINDLNLLFGFVFSAIENSTIYSDKENGEAKKHEWKSLLYQAKASKSERNRGCDGLEEKPKVFNGQSDKPSTDMKDVEKRFTTMPKANNHPTVKPLKLMEYLIKKVTPKGGIVLDPFAGSGTTLVAAKQNGYQYIGIEKEKEYIKIIKERLK